MVEIRDRDQVTYTTDPAAGPSAALIVLFSLLIVAVLGFMIYYFSNNSNLNQPQIIERNTNTTTTIPVPTPSATPATPNINIAPPASSGNSSSGGSSDNSSSQ